MRILASIWAALTLFALYIHAPAFAEDKAPPSQTEPKAAQGLEPKSTLPPNPLPAAKTTSFVLNLPDRSLHFNAIAGSIPIYDGQSGTHEADIAFTAFLLDSPDPSKRPLTFAINGGPGAASAWLDLGALGPWRLPVDVKALATSSSPKLIDNAETWLDFTDLVFIDPPGTGYSRILAKGEGAGKHFYSVNGDIELLGVVIRKWLNQHQRLLSPIFITGESYGGFRAPKLAHRLQNEEGIGVHGLILISPVLDFGWSEGANNPLPFVTRLPSLAAAARGLDAADAEPRLADVEAYAKGSYLADLLAGQRDVAALDRMSEKVAGFLGLDPALVRKLGGRVDGPSFARESHRKEGLVASQYDAKILGLDPEPSSASSDYPDPILDGVKTPLASAMADLTANRLGWPIEARYEILNENVVRQWDWGGHGRPEAISDLKRALAIDPKLKVLIAHGYSDLVTPYFASKLLIGQIAPLGDENRLQLKLYGGGHMLYFEDQSRKALRDDARKLIEGR
jgi:carboxypeptidase C (cathepsin A)